MVGSIGPGQGLAAFAVARANAHPGAANPVDSLRAGTAHHGTHQSEGEPSSRAGSGQQLSESEEKQVRELKKRDAEVRAHEQAHARVGGAYAGSPSYTFQVGPDGKRYAVGGEVQIDAAPIAGNPEATIRKLEIVIRAALAPADPSSQDLKVAAAAREGKLKAQAELRAQKQEELSGDGSEETDAANPAGAGKSGESGNVTDAQGLLSLIKAQEEAQKDDDGSASSPHRGEEHLRARPARSNALDGIKAYQERLTQRDESGIPNEANSRLPTHIRDRSFETAERLARVA